MVKNSDMHCNQHDYSVEKELDIRGLFRTLWQGKLTILLCAIVFAIVALGASFLMQQKWSATAITDLPTVNNLSSYYSQQQFLRNIDSHVNQNQDGQVPSIASEAYGEFLKQLGSYDTRRQFWLQSEYYQKRKEGNVKVDVVLLEDYIDNIQYTPADTLKGTNDSITLVADNAAEASQLLKSYIAFANTRASGNLNDEVKGQWAVKTQSTKSLVEREEKVANATQERRLNILKQALIVANKQGITRKQTSAPIDELPDSKMFLLGVPLLQSQIEALNEMGSEFTAEYDQNMAMLMTLEVGPRLQDNFQAYRYLRTPEEPIKRDSPRRLFMIILWGMTGVFVGAVVALSRRKFSVKSN